ncbi:hypothetical protein ACA910_019824 [Epithemia clementina (nom. ined.)]
MSHDDPDPNSSDAPDDLIHFIHQAVSQDTNHPASNLEHIMSISKAGTNTPNSKTTASSSPPTKQKAHMACHVFSRKSSHHSQFQLVDCGANGGLASTDMCILEKSGRFITIVGIDNHELTGFSRRSP